MKFDFKHCTLNLTLNLNLSLQKGWYLLMAAISGTPFWLTHSISCLIIWGDGLSLVWDLISSIALNLTRLQEGWYLLMAAFSGTLLSLTNSISCLIIWGDGLSLVSDLTSSTAPSKPNPKPKSTTRLISSYAAISGTLFSLTHSNSCLIIWGDGLSLVWDLTGEQITRHQWWYLSLDLARGDLWL